MRVSRAIIALIAAASLCALPGCTSSVKGRVVTESSGEAIAGALVAISDNTTSTAADGSFVLDGIKNGQSGGVVRVKGYPDTRFTVSPTGVLVKVADSRLSVAAVENAVEPKRVASYRVYVDGQEASGTSGIGPLAPGVHLIRVTAKDHETAEMTCTLKAGSNEVTASLNLTALETYRRFFYVGQFHRTESSYKYVHPDERKVLSLKKWQEWGAGTEDKSIKFGDQRVLPKWTSPYLKKTYQRVTEIDRTVEYQVTDTKYSDFGRTYTDNFSQHWVKLGGKWFIVHAKGP